ncbi:MAG: zinc ribbon domain-containing protein [Candidatus Heimdallarchaeota archaeon]|nr:zinc ribbon domain-containing protein [Candidatus Heimdallarchaeota archaeon]
MVNNYNCKHCGANFEDKAEICPKCGNKIHQSDEISPGKYSTIGNFQTQQSIPVTIKQDPWNEGGLLNATYSIFVKPQKAIAILGAPNAPSPYIYIILAIFCVLVFSFKLISLITIIPPNDMSAEQATSIFISSTLFGSIFGILANWFVGSLIESAFFSPGINPQLNIRYKMGPTMRKMNAYAAILWCIQYIILFILLSFESNVETTFERAPYALSPQYLIISGILGLIISILYVVYLVRVMKIGLKYEGFNLIVLSIIIVMFQIYNVYTLTLG